MESSTNKIPITIRRILRMLDNPKSLSGKELVTVAEVEEVFPEVVELLVLDVILEFVLFVLSVLVLELVLFVVETSEVFVLFVFCVTLLDEKSSIRSSVKFKSTA